MSTSRKQAAVKIPVVRPPRARGRLDPLTYLDSYRARTLDVLARLDLRPVATVLDILRDALEQRRHVFVCGNGGSASTASHLAAGLGKESSHGRTHRFRVMSLTDNVPWITSLANDADYSAIFVEQLENFAQEGDVLLTFSGSGNSLNVLRAVEWANANGLTTIGVSGHTGGQLADLVQHAVLVPSAHMGHAEEAHFLIQHLLSYYFEDSE